MQQVEERPLKKRRFFVDVDDDDVLPKPDHAISKPSDASSEYRDESAVGMVDQSSSLYRGSSSLHDSDQTAAVSSFAVDEFTAIVGHDVPEATVESLRRTCDGDLQRAINLYFDKGLSATATTTTKTHIPLVTDRVKSPSSREPGRVPRESRSVPGTEKVSSSAGKRGHCVFHKSRRKYIGCFGVTGWATRSGSLLMRHGERVNIERTKIGGASLNGKKVSRGTTAASKRLDNIVRFFNERGEEVGRLENDVASWISNLMDQGVCDFDGLCVFAPERIRTNDTIYLQLHCYFRKTAFEDGRTLRLLEDNRQTGVFEAKETEDERALRIRQIGLVKLLDEIKLHPRQTAGNGNPAAHKDLLAIAEAAEVTRPPGASPSAPLPAGEIAEETEDFNELEQGQLDALYKKAQIFDFNMPEMEPATTFTLDLRKYQKQALHWMCEKETGSKSTSQSESIHPLWEEYDWPSADADGKTLNDESDAGKFYINPYSGQMALDFPRQEQHCLGGVLADEMGLGKTIEMMSLIHTRNKAVAADEATSTPLGLNSLRRVSIAPTEVEFAANTTLVVAPMSLLAQWQSEAERASQAGSLKVCVYYGSDKSVDLRSLCSRYTSAGQLMLVITSYGTVLSEYSQVAESGKARAAHGGLFSIEYNRVILDEAHLIKNRQSKTAKACYELHALHRWVLTGTPIVNRLEDLFSLVHFLRVEPWSNFSFWKTFITAPFESKNFLRALNVVQTVLEPLLLRRTKDMKSPSGERLITLPPRTIEIRQIELSGPEREVYDHILTRAKRTFNANVEAGTLMKSYTTIFAQILRLRQSCCHPFLVRGSGGGSSGAAGADGDEAATASADAASGLADDVDLQSLIDQFTDGEGQDPGRMQHRFEAHVLRQIQQEADNECPICSDEPMKEQTVTSCWHSACKACLLSYIDRQQKQSEVVRCFTCREALSLPDTFEVVRETGRFGAVRNTVSDDSTNNDGDGNDSTNGTNNNGNGNGAQPSIPSPDGAHNISLRRLGQESSAKIAALLDSLRALRQQDPALKSVVFSQFTSFLDLIAAKLDKNGIGHLRLDGTLSQKQRAAVLVAYAAPGAAAAARGTVLLISLRAGGVGLNLTTARRVFLMDPWWSFAVEAQAIDRVHRMGQEHQVTVHRFIVADSIEEKMLKIQDRKKFIAGSLGMLSDEEKKTQRIEDIKELLS